MSPYVPKVKMRSCCLHTVTCSQYRLITITFDIIKLPKCNLEVKIKDENKYDLNTPIIEEWRLLGCYTVSQKTPFFIVTAVKTASLTPIINCAIHFLSNIS
jgi:hypothetical protein